MPNTIDTLLDIAKQRNTVSILKSINTIDFDSIMYLLKEMSGPRYLSREEDVSVFTRNVLATNMRDKTGRTLLSLAADLFCIDQNLRLPKLLVSCSAEINSSDTLSGYCPLHVSVLHGDINYEMSELLLGNGADVNRKNRLGETPIFYAFGEKTIRLLIQYGADLNYTSNDGFPPLLRGFTAVPKKAWLEKARLLIDNGADINFRISDDYICDLLKKIGNVELVELLKSQGAKSRSA